MHRVGAGYRDSNDLTGSKTGITSVFSKDKTVDKPIYGLGRMFENASKDYANEPLGGMVARQEARAGGGHPPFDVRSNAACVEPLAGAQRSTSCVARCAWRSVAWRPRCTSASTPSLSSPRSSSSSWT